MNENVIDKLIKLIKSKKLTSAYFDDFVHQTASIEASKINKKGLQAQISYLMETGWTKEDIRETFK